MVKVLLPVTDAVLHINSWALLQHRHQLIWILPLI